MKWVDDGTWLQSEGKILEVTPVVEINGGVSIYSLPAAMWVCENALLGFKDTHVIGRAYNFSVSGAGGSIFIPGSNSSDSYRLTFDVRLLEHSQSLRPRGMAR